MSRILLVDDETNLRHTVGYALRREGHEVATAEDGEKGLEVFRATKPDLVILDLMLPRMDGLAVCRAIRRESDVPVIMLTARDTELDTVVGLEVGADDYLTKPFSMVELIARIRAMLRRAAPRHGAPPERAGASRWRAPRSTSSRVSSTCWRIWRGRPAGSSPASSFSLRSGALTTPAIPAPSTRT